jgi:hypothetical protein
VNNPAEDALTVARRALGTGFHQHGRCAARRRRTTQTAERPTNKQIFEQVMTLGKRSYSRFNQFQHNIAKGKPNEWRCRSGARYLYICENGLVHWCSQQRGYPGIPLASVHDGKTCCREYYTEKPCALSLHRLLLSAGRPCSIIGAGCKRCGRLRLHRRGASDWYK